MTAVHFNGEAYNAARHTLAEALPLRFPYSVKLFVSNCCNFRCFYCYQSQPDRGEENGLLRELMDLPLYRRCIDGIAAAGTLKKLLLYGNGEPLLHPALAEMVAYAKSRRAAGLVEVVTNASMLTPARSRALADAGLDSLRISLQGLSAEDYRKNAGVSIDYPRLVENLRYFYEHKKGTRIYLKLLDVMLPDAGERERFYREFEPLCDEIAVEHLIPLVPGAAGGTKGMRGGDALPTQICAMPFYSCTVDCDGQVTPCCKVPFPRKFGSAERFGEVWAGEEYQNFLLRFLRGEKDRMPVCAGCDIPRYTTPPSDRLDEAAKRLAKQFVL